MTYKEWAQEYYESARILEERLKNLKEQMKSAPSEALAEMGRRAELFRIMRYECLSTAKLLGARKGEG